MLAPLVLVLPRAGSRRSRSLGGCCWARWSCSGCSTSASSRPSTGPFDPVVRLALPRPAIGLLGDSVGRPRRGGSRWLAAARRGRAARSRCCRWPLLRLTRRDAAAPARVGCAPSRRWRWSGSAARSSACRSSPGGRSPRRARPRCAVDAGAPGAARRSRDRARRSRRPLAARPAPRPPGRPAAHRAARQGRAARVRRELRPGRRRGLDVLAAGRRGARRRHRDGCGAAGFRARSAFLTSPTFGGVSWLAHSTLQSGLWIDTQQRYDRAAHQRPAHPQPRRSAAPAGAPSATCPSDKQDWPEGRRSTATTRCTTPATSATRGPRFSYARCPTSTRSPRSSASSSRPDHAPGDGRDRPGVEPHPVDAAAPPGRLATRSATARCSTGCPPRGPRRSRSAATPTRCGPPTPSRSTTRCSRWSRSCGPTPTTTW